MKVNPEIIVSLVKDRCNAPPNVKVNVAKFDIG